MYSLFSKNFQVNEISLSDNFDCHSQIPHCGNFLYSIIKFHEMYLCKFKFHNVTVHEWCMHCDLLFLKAVKSHVPPK